MSNSGAVGSKKEPWPMWPLAVSILAFIVVYTYINLNYRKEGQAYEPAQAMKERMEAALEKNIYGWHAVEAKRVAQVNDTSSEGITLSKPEKDLTQILPSDLVYSRHEPKLITNIGSVESDQSITQGEPLNLTLSLPPVLVADERFHLTAFYREGGLHIFGEVFVDKISQARDILLGELAPASFAIPTDPFDAPEISVNLYTEGKVHRWTVPVQQSEVQTQTSETTPSSDI
ncbi:MAG: hypothetical protein AAGB46_11430 [Verrucomicrobiota bacterium]